MRYSRAACLIDELASYTIDKAGSIFNPCSTSDLPHTLWRFASTRHLHLDVTQEFSRGQQCLLVAQQRKMKLGEDETRRLHDAESHSCVRPVTLWAGVSNSVQAGCFRK